ncbi:MAG: hypothetical protein IJX14_04915 [Clostridia bacterium]|nr:hypothetical protein [Clostridia bacterium]
MLEGFSGGRFLYSEQTRRGAPFDQGLPLVAPEGITPALVSFTAFGNYVSETA